MVKTHVDEGMQGSFERSLHQMALVGNHLGLDKLLCEETYRKQKDSQNDRGMREDRFNKYTPLHIAAMNGHIECVQVLVKHRVKLNVKDFHGRTPLDLAQESGHSDVFEFLKEQSSLAKGSKSVACTVM